MNKRAEIPNLLQQLILISDSKRTMILEKYLVFDAITIEKIYNFLVVAIQEQKKFVTQKVAENPMLLGVSKRKILETSLKNLNEKELQQKKEETEELKKIDLYLESIV